MVVGVGGGWGGGGGGCVFFFFFNDTATTEIYTLSLHDALPISTDDEALEAFQLCARKEGIIPALEPSHALARALDVAAAMDEDQILLLNMCGRGDKDVFTVAAARSEEHTSELQSPDHLVCRLLLEKKKKKQQHK